MKKVAEKIKAAAQALTAPNPAAAGATGKTRREVVEGAHRVLKLLLPLEELCRELGEVDNIDRMTHDANVRAQQHAEAAAKVAEQREVLLQQLEAEIAERRREDAEASAAADKAAREKMEAADKAALKATQEAADNIKALQSAAQKKLGKIEDAISDAEARLVEVEARTAESVKAAADAEARIEKARKQVAALLP
ncbi:MAG TPA: hypothetical protein DCZ11_01710 [Gammaproteobacteria bacterium]|nr:hypothetical protein [Gammaproteobacteria bacterium]MCH77141.1 hypothetical protein [Gammaproteobacteria bacterium]